MPCARASSNGTDFTVTPRLAERRVFLRASCGSFSHQPSKVAASTGAPADAGRPSRSINGFSVSGCLDARRTSWPASTHNFASVDPIIPAPTIPMRMMVSRAAAQPKMPSYRFVGFGRPPIRAGRCRAPPLVPALAPSPRRHSSMPVGRARPPFGVGRARARRELRANDYRALREVSDALDSCRKKRREPTTCCRSVYCAA